MALHTPANFAGTTLSGSHTSGITTLTLATGGLALLKGASSYPFYAVIHDSSYTNKEIVEITGTPGTDQATAVRGVDGSAATAWSGGETIEQNPTAAYIIEMQKGFRSNKAMRYDYFAGY